jgi:hypothetical protein
MAWLGRHWSAVFAVSAIVAGTAHVLWKVTG